MSSPITSKFTAENNRDQSQLQLLQGAENLAMSKSSKSFSAEL